MYDNTLKPGSSAVNFRIVTYLVQDIHYCLTHENLLWLSPLRDGLWPNNECPRLSWRGLCLSIYLYHPIAEVTFRWNVSGVFNLPFSFPTISQYWYRDIILSVKSLYYSTLSVSRYCRQCGARHCSSFPLIRGPCVLFQYTAVSIKLIHAIFPRVPEMSVGPQTRSLHTSKFVS